MNENRLSVVNALLGLSLPLDGLQKQLNEFDWDFNGAPVALLRIHVLNILRRYLRGELTAFDVERWANAVEGRDDISFDSDRERWAVDTVYELANPVVTMPLDIERAKTMIAEGERI